MTRRTHLSSLAVPVVIAGMLVAGASWHSLHAQIRQCQDPDVYCTAKGCFPENGQCQNAPVNYTSRTVESFLVSICLDGDVPDCDDLMVATCMSKGWVADATKACGTTVCWAATFALGCD